MRSSYSNTATPVKAGTPAQHRTPETPVVPTLSALSRGLTPKCSPRTRMHKFMPFSPTEVGSKPKALRPRTGGPRAKWIDVESARPHTARNADKSNVFSPEESRRPHTSRYESKHHVSPGTDLELSVSLNQSAEISLNGHGHATDVGASAVLGGTKPLERRLFSKVPVPTIAATVSQEMLQANDATFAGIREQLLKAEVKAPERAWPLHVEPTKKLYSSLPLEHTLTQVFGEAKREEWGDDENETFQFEDMSAQTPPRKSQAPRPPKARSEIADSHTPRHRNAFMSPESMTSKQSHLTTRGPSSLSAASEATTVRMPERSPSGPFPQSAGAFRTASASSVSSQSARSEVSAPAAVQAYSAPYLEPERVERVLRGLPLVCGGRVRVSTDFGKVLRRKEQDLQGRVVAALQQKAEEAKYRKHIVMENSQQAWSAATLSTESLQNWHAVRDLRMHHAKKKKEAIETARQLFREQALEWKVSYSRTLKDAETRFREMADQSFLFASVVLAARAGVWRQRLAQHRAAKSEQRQQAWAVAVIAKKFRERMLAKYKKRYREQLLALAMRFAGAVQRWRARARRRKAEIIITFLQEVAGSAKLQVALKRFRTKITRCQRIARQYIECNRARYHLLELQWDHVDEMRIRAFVRNRAEQLHRVKRALTPSMRLGGSKLEEMNSKMRMIANIGGPKTLRKCQLDMDQARNKYLELFLSADMKEVPKISPIIKKKMLEMYVKKIRMQYTQEYVAYRKRLDNWSAMQQTHQSLTLVANSMISEVEGTSGETYLVNRLREVLDLDTPRPPNMNMVLKRETMYQVVLKAVEHTRRLEARQFSRERSAERAGAVDRIGSVDRPPRQAPAGVLRPGHQSNRDAEGELGDEASPAPKKQFRRRRMEGLLARIGTQKDVLLI